MHLEPFSSEDARRLLAASFGEYRSSEIVAHFKERGLADLFDNPQTLRLIEAAASKGDLLETRIGLFEAAIDVMWAEHSDRKQDRDVARMGKAAVPGSIVDG